jgi:hypothetical protein
MATTEATRPAFWVQQTPAISKRLLAGRALSSWLLAFSQTRPNPQTSPNPICADLLSSAARNGGRA